MAYRKWYLSAAASSYRYLYTNYFSSLYPKYIIDEHKQFLDLTISNDKRIINNNMYYTPGVKI